MLLLMVGGMNGAFAQADRYVVLVGKTVRADTTWNKVVRRLVELHGAETVEYDMQTSEALPRLRELFPRYVAVVEKPERVSREFVTDLNRMCRRVDEDIYADFLWGIITGYDAEAALRLVERAQQPAEIGRAWCMRVDEFADGRYFEQMGRGTSDGKWGEKNGAVDNVTFWKPEEDPQQLEQRMIAWVEKYQPEFIFYQTEELKNQMRLFQGGKEEQGIVKPQNGKLWVNGRELKLGDHPRVCFTSVAGGNTFHTKENIPMAWLNGGNATALIGSMAFTMHGRGEWGTLKYWLTDAGRFTLAEAHFLNQQEMLFRLNRWSPRLLQERYVFPQDSTKVALACYHAYDAYQKQLEEWTGDKEDMLDKFGYMYEQDIYVYYGDPAWQVRMTDLAKDHPYEVNVCKKGKKWVVTVRTTEHFSWERLCGELCAEYKMGDLHGAVGSLPICYFFPGRLKNPRLAPRQKQALEVTVNKDFLFIHNAYLEPDKTYKIILNTD